ncbi:MAG: peptidoglycan editing factor PgeF [Candidatus Nitricoxidivorans perseverans]|uniref:Purine nucleoside phosphorylase n=1 Tax=Candidatus Nitricoxidivorans perseverans TaxID=2975601 RepID=A0AA49FML0_9PROT|nr:MAG: peptidoglycan editing factor PgeF [Candidatus Nitricoxidivorans perseverans]
MILPDWPAPSGVRALTTTRHAALPDTPDAPRWLRQVHGIVCVAAETALPQTEADASVTRRPGVVCAVRTADCLPVLLCDDEGAVVAAAHAGWRGLAAGVIESTVREMALPGERLMAWLGPAIGPEHFEVGGEVREAFLAADPGAAGAFAARGGDKWLCDLYALARRRLAAMGVLRVHGGGLSTFGDPARFFSYRRDRETGRMASLIWISG